MNNDEITKVNKQTFDWENWKVEMLSSGSKERVNSYELIALTTKLSPGEKNAAKQCLSESNSYYQSEIKNQHQIILKSLTPSGGTASTTFDWGSWKKKTVKQLDNASDKSNEKAVDAVVAKGKTLPPHEQPNFAHLMEKTLVGGFKQLGEDIVHGIVTAADDVEKGLEDAGKAIGNWATGAAHTVAHFFSSIF